MMETIREMRKILQEIHRGPEGAVRGLWIWTVSSVALALWIQLMA